MLHPSTVNPCARMLNSPALGKVTNVDAAVPEPVIAMPAPLIDVPDPVIGIIPDAVNGSCVINSPVTLFLN